MISTSIYQDIATRAGGDIYAGSSPYNGVKSKNKKST